MSRTLLPTPRALVIDGKPVIGLFREPLRNTSLAGTPDLCEPWLPGTLRTARHKHWMGFGISHPQWYMGIMIQDSGMVRSGTFYALRRRDGLLLQHTEPILVPGRLHVADSPFHDDSYARGLKLALHYRHRLDHRRHEVSIHLAAGRHTPAIDGELILTQDPDAVQPLSISLPIPPRHHAYTHKAPLPVEGSLRIGDEVIAYHPDRDFANLDEHHAAYPYDTNWRWGTFAGKDTKGRLLTVNLSEQMYFDPDGGGENCLWIDGDLQMIGHVPFDFQDDKPRAPWRLRGASDRIDLRFTPRGGPVFKQNFGLFSVDYFQLVGEYQGTVVAEDGQRHDVVDQTGVVERMHVRW